MSDELNERKIDDTNTRQPPTRWKQIRIWPPLMLVAGMVFFRSLPQLIEDGPLEIWMAAAFGPAACGVLILLWWLALSRATWQERVVGFFGTILAAGIALACIDKSMLGPAVMVLTIPFGTAAFGIGAVLCSRMLSFKRTAIALLCASLGFGFSDLLRSDGMWGNFALGLHWRWTPSREMALLRNEASRHTPDFEPAHAADAFANPTWPGFRGPDRDGRQHGEKIALDWNTIPPHEIWKIAVGPGWSSFAVAGNMIFTQEQRGTRETVVCYAADSGLEVWTQSAESRFDDPLGGPGPRATPTLAAGGLFVTFATGFLMRLDPATGNVVWQQDVRQVADRQPPVWGFASSPLVVDSVVIVHAGGAGDKGILAFNMETGKLQWSARAGDHSYGSAQLSTIVGERFVLMLTNAGLNMLDPVSGAERLNYEWIFNGYRALQPQVIDSDSILLPSPMGAGTRRIRISRGADRLVAEELWTSRNLKPDFNDLVIYNGHAYGFDGAVFASIDLEKGNRNWRGGRYGKGQVLLLEDSGALLVIGEHGEVVLLKADPSAHIELTKFQAIEGKTWNHPVVVGNRLYIRNSQEAACYRLPLADAESSIQEKK